MKLGLKAILLFGIMGGVGCMQKHEPAPSSIKHMVTRQDFLLGHYDPAQHPDFVKIDDRYGDKPDMYMQREAYEAFLKMAAAGESDGLSFCILSATRNFDYQKVIWENKWMGIYPIGNNINAYEKYPDELVRAKKILEYSAMPGTSRHHWGTDIDINALDNKYFQTDYKDWYEWMKTNAAQFGYYQPYTRYSKNRPVGYKEEKWHWSYVPLAKTYLAEAALIIDDTAIAGFRGDAYSDVLDVVNNYILGIHPDCK